MSINVFERKVNLNNLFFIDTHTHGSFGINFNYSTYEETKYLLKELYKKSIVAICPTLVGETNENIQKQLAIFKKIKDEQLKENEKEAYIIGAHLEGNFLNPKKSGIQDITTFLKPTIENFKNLVGNYEDIVKIVTIAPELDIDLIEYLNNKEIITQAGHTISNSVQNCIGVTHLFNAMNGIHHREPSLVLEVLNSDTYCEVIPDLIHTSENILKILLKCKNKENVLLISDSLPSSNYDKDIIFCNKKINSFGKDENGVLAGSNKTLDEICKDLIANNILNKEDVTKMAFENQVKYLKLNSKEKAILNSLKL